MSSTDRTVPGQIACTTEGMTGLTGSGTGQPWKVCSNGNAGQGLILPSTSEGLLGLDRSSTGWCQGRCTACLACRCLQTACDLLVQAWASTICCWSTVTASRARAGSAVCACKRRAAQAQHDGNCRTARVEQHVSLASAGPGGSLTIARSCCWVRRACEEGPRVQPASCSAGHLLQCCMSKADAGPCVQL